MHDLLFIGMEHWDEVWRRSQSLAAGLARRFPEHKILFVSLPVDFSHAIRAGRWEVIRKGARPVPPQPVPGLPNIFVFHPVKLLPHTLLPCRLLSEARIRAQIRSAARALGMEKPLLWIKPHWAAHMVGRMGERAVVYDVGDDWSAISQPAFAKRRTVAEDTYLTRRADAVIVVSERLREQKAALIDHVNVIPNGVEVERYAPICERTLPPHPLTQGWTRPVLGYTGMLHPDRLDIDLLVAAARAFPEGTVALVGPNMLDEGRVRRLEAEPNIRLTGPVAHSELPQVMTAFDVCIVPNLVNAFSESQNPLKLFEYLASGLPTVTTPVSGFRDYPDLVYLADTREAFVAAIRAALVESPELPPRRRLAVREQTWEARVDAVLRVFDSLPSSPSSPSMALTSSRQ
jgi:glycosyltransferase involved in cell wall biosynthesis